MCVCLGGGGYCVMKCQHLENLNNELIFSKRPMHDVSKTCIEKRFKVQNTPIVVKVHQYGLKFHIAADIEEINVVFIFLYYIKECSHF